MDATKKPALVAINFVLTSSINEAAAETRWEVEVIWQGLDRKYLGTLVRTREVAIRDDDGTALIKCRLETMPLTAEFALPAETGDPRNLLTAIEAATTKRTARELIAAAFRGCGYEVAQWVTA